MLVFEDEWPSGENIAKGGKSGRGDTTPQRRDFTNDGTTVKVSDAFMEELAAIAKNNIILSYIQLNIYILWYYITLYVKQ